MNPTTDEMNIATIRSSNDRDLYADVQCNCKRWPDSPLDTKKKIVLTGYNDDYFFNAVNADFRTISCPDCGVTIRYRWTLDGVLWEVK